ncbi:MAG: sulfatase [Thermodesulfovibrionia bacterium]
MKWKFKVEHVLLFICFFVLFAGAVWLGNKFIFQEIQEKTYGQYGLFFTFIIAAISITWLLRKKSELWIGTIQKKITPLVLLFGFWFIVSMPIVAYHTWVKQPEKVISQEPSRFFAADKVRPNIILIIFDAMTARDMSAYGYHRRTTPFINKLAKSSSLFKNAQAESNLTTPAVASLMTGKRLWTHQTYHLKGSRPVKGASENLPLMLKKNGYYTMAFVANPAASVNGLGIAESFDFAPVPTEFVNPDYLIGIIYKSLYQLFGDKIRLHNWIMREDFILRGLWDAIHPDFTKTGYPPEKIFESFLSVIEDNPQEPFFAWIHLFPPHSPYLPPSPYMGMFDKSADLRTLKKQGKIPLYEFKREDQADIDILRARYDEFIRYCDRQFEVFLALLEAKNELKNTVIILSSDHGESFEHNYQQHSGPHLYEQLIHIPLLIKEPNQKEGGIIDNVVAQIDIPPTILELADIPIPSWMEGRSLVPLMRGKSLSVKPGFSMNFEKNFSRGHQITRGSISVREGDYKLIHYLEGKKSLLFNVIKDPDELNNLFDKEPELGRNLLSFIKDNLKNANERIGNGM